VPPAAHAHLAAAHVHSSSGNLPSVGMHDMPAAQSATQYVTGEAPRTGGTPRDRRVLRQYSPREGCGSTNSSANSFASFSAGGSGHSLHGNSPSLHNPSHKNNFYNPTHNPSHNNPIHNPHSSPSPAFKPRFAPSSGEPASLSAPLSVTLPSPYSAVRGGGAAGAPFPPNSQFPPNSHRPPLGRTAGGSTGLYADSAQQLQQFVRSLGSGDAAALRAGGSRSVSLSVVSLGAGVVPVRRGPEQLLAHSMPHGGYSGGYPPAAYAHAGGMHAGAALLGSSQGAYRTQFRARA